MAYVNTNEHSANLLHGFREFHREEIATSLTVDLLQNVGGLAQIERISIAASDYLGRNLVLTEHLLVHLVDLLTSKNNKTKSGMSERTLLRLHHELHQAELQLALICFVFQLDPVWLFNLDLKLF